MFCQVTGFAGTTQRVVRASDVVLDRMITVRFDANVAPGLAWKFEPVQRTVDVRLGETTLIHYRATNVSDRATTGTATFNVAPEISGIFFNKLECFCFQEQLLEPGQSVDMPVSFYVDPSLLKDGQASGLSEITLSYTFYAVASPRAVTLNTDQRTAPLFDGKPRS
jgi:cytochrome c oxidase assembly protein subunit 11